MKLIIEVRTARLACNAELIKLELKVQAADIGRRRVARIMRKNDITGITRLERRNLARAATDATAIQGLLQRRFTAPMPALKLTGDI